MECALYLTDMCNYTCTYCYQSDVSKSKKFDMEMMKESIEYILSNNAKDEKIYLTLMGGEPLLEKKVIHKLVESVNNDYPEYKDLFTYILTTNCSLLDEEFFTLMNENTFRVRLSLDGDEVTHNINRKNKGNVNDYNKIFNWAKRINSSTIQSSIRMTVTPNNVGMFYDNIVYFYKHGFQNISVGIDSFARWSDLELSVLDVNLDSIKRLLIQMRSQRSYLEIDLFDGNFTQLLFKKNPIFCSAGTRGHLVINGHGNVFPCTYVVNDDDWIIGSVSTQYDKKKFLSAIKSNVGKDLLFNVSADEIVDANECSTCDVRAACYARKCGFKNLKQTGSLNITKRQLCFIQKLVLKHADDALTKLLSNKDHKLMKILKLNDISINGKYSGFTREISKINLMKGGG